MPWPILVGGAISGLGGWLGGMAQEEEAKRARETSEARSARARKTLSTYGAGYQPYASPLQAQQQSTLAQFLSGELSPAQTKAIGFQRKKGYAGIARQAAGAGTPMGGRSALAVQLERDLALGAGQLAGQQQQFGLTAGVPYENLWLQNWLATQQVPLRKTELMARYG